MSATSGKIQHTALKILSRFLSRSSEEVPPFRIQPKDICESDRRNNKLTLRAKNVPTKRERPQTRHVSEPGRNGATQSIVAEVKRRHGASTVITGDPVPLAFRAYGAQPAVAVSPAVTECIVEDNKKCGALLRWNSPLGRDGHEQTGEYCAETREKTNRHRPNGD